MQQLEQGTTGDHIWDAMQHQLNTNGAIPHKLPQPLDVAAPCMFVDLFL